MRNRHLLLIDGRPTELVARPLSSGAADAGALVALDANGQLDMSLLPNDAVFASVVITQPPSQDAHAVGKGYVDARINGLTWQRPIKGLTDFTAAEPASPMIGDRYINTAAGTSSGTAQPVNESAIYEWNGSVWTETPAVETMALWDRETNELLNYSGGEWIDFGNVTEHNVLSGIQGGAEGERYHLTAEQHSAVKSIPDPTLLPDGQVLITVGGEWVAMALTEPTPGACERYLITSDGVIFNTSLGAFCLSD